MLKWFKKKKKHKTPDTILQAGYELDENGLTKCSTCGTYCGQCGIDRSGLTEKDFLKNDT